MFSNMQKVSPKHRALGHTITELEARKNPHGDLSLPVTSVVAPLVSPLLGNGAGGSAQPSVPPNPQPAPISTPGGGSSGGNGGGNPPTATASPTSSGGAAVPPVPIVLGPTFPGPAPGQPSGSSGTNSPSPSISMASSSSPDGGGSPANVASELSTANSAALGASTLAALASSSSSPSQYSLGSDFNTAGAAAPTITPAAAVSPGKQLSGGTVSGIIVVCLFSLFALVLLVVRRRSIARRVELRRQWWFGRRPSGRNLSHDNSGSPHNPGESSGEVPASRLSARSSFATNFDHGLMFRIDSPSTLSQDLVPSLPPTAEVRERNSVLIFTGGAVARRESMNSMLSNGSEPDTQYLIVSTGQNNLQPSTPMSVRPFSPSESFAFPKPPVPSSSSVNTFFLSGTQVHASPQSSATTLVHLSTPPRAFMADLPPAPTSTSFHPETSTPSATLSPFTAPDRAPIDPFVDLVKPGFSGVEMIRRPFVPSLDDELAVRSGDHVRLLRIFDDGWAFVEKLAGNQGERRERGLIPVDCFREADRAPPTFLAEKRVSYGSEQLVAVAL